MASFNLLKLQINTTKLYIILRYIFVSLFLQILAKPLRLPGAYTVATLLPLPSCILYFMDQKVSKKSYLSFKLLHILSLLIWITIAYKFFWVGGYYSISLTCIFILILL